MWYALVVTVIEWTLLMLLKTHYIIDLVTGMFIAHYMSMTGEKMSYFLDVKLFGWRAHERH